MYTPDQQYSAYSTAITTKSKAELLDLLEEVVASLREEIESGEEQSNGTYAYSNLEVIAYAMKHMED